MRSAREYPDRPIIGIGGIVIHHDRALLIRRGSEPLRGHWSIPGGSLELGETLEQGTTRELLEETGLEVRTIGMVEVFERILFDSPVPRRDGKVRPRYHYVIVDYLCERLSGEPCAGGDALEVVYAREDELEQFHLTETALRVLRKAFAMYRGRLITGQD
jgi:8-oxo-dGTP diphosphatase